ncbi:MAG TPA: hypothetical protein DCM71_10485 [Runella sp.]|nr:hypothetical protein [Runella sp.]
MFKPSQYENIETSTIVLGADILQKLKKKRYNLEDLFNEIRKKKEITVNQFLNSITFLWLVEAIDYSGFTLSVREHVS